MDTQAVYRATLAEEEKVIAQIRERLQRLAAAPPQPDEMPPRNVAMPLLELQYNQARERLGILQANPPLDNAWPAPWVAMFNHAHHEHRAAVDALARRMGIQVNHPPMPGHVHAAHQQDDMHLRAQAAHAQMARRHQEEQIQVLNRRREEDARRRGLGENDQAPPPPAPPAAAAKRPPQQPAEVRGAPAERMQPAPARADPLPAPQPLPPQMRQRGPPPPPPQQQAPIDLGNIIQNNLNNMLNELGQNMGGVAMGGGNIGIGGVLPQQLQQPQQQHVAGPQLVVDQTKGGNKTLKGTIKGLLFHSVALRPDMDKFTFFSIITGYMVMVDLAMSVFVHTSCSLDDGQMILAGGETNEVYRQCINDPFNNFNLLQIIAFFLLTVLMAVPFRAHIEVAHTIIATFASYRLVAPPPTPRNVSVIARVSFRIAVAIMGEQITGDTPPSALRFDIMGPMTLLLWLFVAFPTLVKGGTNPKWLQARASHLGKLVALGMFIQWVLFGWTSLAVSPHDGDLEADLRQLFQAMLLLPSGITVGTVLATAILEGHILAGGWMPGSGGSCMANWMWWANSAMQFNTLASIDTIATSLLSGRVSQELIPMIELAQEQGNMEADPSSSGPANGTQSTELDLEAKQRLRRRVIPLEILNRTRGWAVGLVQHVVVSLLRNVVCAPWLWLLLPVGILALSLGTIYRPIFLDALVLMVIVPIIRLQLFPLPQDSLVDYANNGALPAFSCHVLGSAIDSHQKQQPSRSSSLLTRAIYATTEGFIGAKVARDFLAWSNLGKVPVMLVTETRQEGMDANAQPLVTTRHVKFDILGIEGALPMLSKVEDEGELSHTMRYPPLAPADFLSHIKVIMGGNNTRTVPLHLYPIEGLFRHLATAHGPIGVGLDEDREAFAAMLMVLNAVQHNAEPERLLQRLLSSNAFIQLVRIAILKCGELATRPPGKCPFVNRRLPYWEWQSAQTDHEVMAQMLPTSGMLLQLAVYCLDGHILQAHGVSISRAEPLPDLQSREALQDKRRVLAKALYAAQRPLATSVLTMSHKLCLFVTNCESLNDAVDGRALPPFALVPDAARPTDPEAVTVHVEPLTVKENTTLNMRGMAARLLATVLAWEGVDDEIRQREQGEGGGELSLQRRIELGGALSGKDNHPLQSLPRFTKSVLFIIARRRFMRVMTNSFYVGMLELASVLMLPTEEERHNDKGSLWLSSSSDTRMYHKTGDMPIMPPYSFKVEQLPLKVRPYDSGMRVFDLMMQLFDAEHWAILSALAPADPFAPHRIPALIAEVMRQPMHMQMAQRWSTLAFREIRFNAVKSAFSTLPRVWQSLQQRLLDQLTYMQFKTSVEPQPAMTESRDLWRTIQGHLASIDSVLQIAINVLESDAVGHDAASDAARATFLTSLGAELKGTLLSVARSTNGLVCDGNTDFGTVLGGVLDPYALILEEPLRKLFELGVGPADCFKRFPNSDTSPMATRAVKAAKGREALLSEAQSEPIFLPVFEQAGTTNGTPLNLISLPPIGAIASGSALAPLQVPSQYLSPLDVHRWFIQATFSHAHHIASTLECKLRTRAMCRRLLLALDSLSAAAASHACHDKGFSVTPAPDTADLCTICLEPLDGNGKWTDDCLLTLRERDILVSQGQGTQSSVTEAITPQALLDTYLAHLPVDARKSACDTKSATIWADTDESNPTMKTACGHFFHLGCLVSHLRSAPRGQGKCPMCRSTLLPEASDREHQAPPAPQRDRPPVAAAAAAPQPVVELNADDRAIPIAALD